MISTNLADNINFIEETLPIGISYDIMTRDLFFGQTKVFWIGLNGLSNTEMLQRIFSDLQTDSNSTIDDINKYVNSHIGYVQTTFCSEMAKAISSILTGCSVLFIDGFSTAIILDTRAYPLRGIEEPSTEKVLKGAQECFIESILSNSSLIRRRIKNPNLTFEIFNVGTESKTDVAIAYTDYNASADLINYLRNKLTTLDVTTLTLGTRSLEELLIKKHWYTPMPSIFTTERPDVACSYITEGHIAILVDNSPSVIILPCTIFQFTQAPADYYKSLTMGNYVRFIRFICVLLGLFTLPVYMIFQNDISALRMFVYAIAIEFALDLFKYSTSHAPNAYSGSLSLIGGLILSDSAIKLNWTSPEIIFYGALTMLATLALSHIDYSEAIRLYRLLLVLCTGFAGIAGFIIGLILILFSIIKTPTLPGRSYFWPLYPFDWTSLKHLLFRFPTYVAQPIHKKKSH